MNIDAFLDVSTLRPNARAERELARLLPVVEPRLEQSYEQIESAINAIIHKWPGAAPIAESIRRVIWDVISLPDVVYRRAVAVLNVTRAKQAKIRFPEAARVILLQEPAADVPEQAAFIAFMERLYSLWSLLSEYGYYKPREDLYFSEDALLPIRPLHPGTNALNANYLPGRRHALPADRSLTLRMCGQGRQSEAAIQIQPRGALATVVAFEDQTLELDQLHPTVVVGRPLRIEELFRLQVVDETGRPSSISFPVDGVLVRDKMYSRGALRITRVVGDDGAPSVFVTENGTFYDVDLGDRRYVSGPDERTGLSGFTYFFADEVAPEPSPSDSWSSI